MTTTATINRHRHLLQRLGPRGLDELSGPVTDEEVELIVAYLEQNPDNDPIDRLTREALDADGSVRNEDAFAVLADIARLDAYLTEAS